MCHKSKPNRVWKTESSLWKDIPHYCQNRASDNTGLLSWQIRRRVYFRLCFFKVSEFKGLMLKESFEGIKFSIKDIICHCKSELVCEWAMYISQGFTWNIELVLSCLLAITLRFRINGRGGGGEGARLYFVIFQIPRPRLLVLGSAWTHRLLFCAPFRLSIFQFAFPPFILTPSPSPIF